MLDVDYVRSVLERMKIEDPDFRVFGANAHQYRLGEPLSESEVLEFEEANQLRLPEDYRHFLIHIGDGRGMYVESDRVVANTGAGPKYGLFPFREVVRDCLPNQPFPWRVADIGLEGIIGREAMAQWEIEYPGMLLLCSQGCSGYYNLVVKGESHGTIWSSRDYDCHLFPVGATFAQWYGHWLHHLVETAIPLLHRERVVENVQIGMTKKEVIAICGRQGEVRGLGSERYTFLSFPHLVSQFELDTNQRVTRIVKHKISFPSIACFS